MLDIVLILISIQEFKYLYQSKSSIEAP